MYFLNAEKLLHDTQSAGKLFHIAMGLGIKEPLRWLVRAGGMQYFIVCIDLDGK